MAPQAYIAQVTERELLAGSFQYLHLELVRPPRIVFQAGQYISILVNKAEGLRRSYSIASQPGMNHGLELLVDVKPGGPGSRYTSLFFLLSLLSTYIFTPVKPGLGNITVAPSSWSKYFI